MATARKTTKEVTTYTLELSEDERDWLMQRVGGMAASGMSATIFGALKHADETPSPAPLAVGNLVKILDFEGAYFECMDDGDIACVTEIGEYGFEVSQVGGDNTDRLPTDGEGTIWEHV